MGKNLNLEDDRASQLVVDVLIDNVDGLTFEDIQSHHCNKRLATLIGGNKELLRSTLPQVVIDMCMELGIQWDPNHQSEIIGGIATEIRGYKPGKAEKILHDQQKAIKSFSKLRVRDLIGYVHDHLPNSEAAS